MLSCLLLLLSVDIDARILTVNITEVSPVKAYFVRAENAYNVTMKVLDKHPKIGDMNTKLMIGPSLRAPRYRILDRNFSLSTKLKKLTVEELEDDMQKYGKLKTRIIVDSLKLSGVVSVAAWVAGGVDVGFAYSSGCLFGAAYLYLLGKRVDVIGYGISGSEASRAITRKDEILGNARFYTPLFLVFFLAARHFIFDNLFGDNVSQQPHRVLFHLLEKEEFLAAIAGFLTHRITLFYTEIFGQMTQSDWLSFLPGSFAETFRQKESLAAIMSAGAAGSNKDIQSKELVTVICVTGPQASGRSTVVNKFLNLHIESLGKQSKTFRNSKMFLQACKFVTTDANLSMLLPEKYQLLPASEFEALELTSSLVDINTIANSTQARQQAVFIGNYTSLFNGDIPVSLYA